MCRLDENRTPCLDQLQVLSISLCLRDSIFGVIVAESGDCIRMEVFASCWIWQIGALAEKSTKEMEDSLSVYVVDGSVSVMGKALASPKPP